MEVLDQVLVGKFHHGLTTKNNLQTAVNTLRNQATNKGLLSVGYDTLYHLNHLKFLIPMSSAHLFNIMAVPWTHADLNIPIPPGVSRAYANIPDPVVGDAPTRNTFDTSEIVQSAFAALPIYTRYLLPKCTSMKV
jgi:hypothetical protein